MKKLPNADPTLPNGHPDMPRTLACPVRTSLNVLGGKWKLLIVSCLLDAPRRYGELRRLLPEITEKMLIQQLRELEDHGLLTRTIYQQVPPRVDYALTEPGRRSQPVFEALLAWGQDYLQQDGVRGCVERFVAAA